jgi:hypothetical protein
MSTKYFKEEVNDAEENLKKERPEDRLSRQRYEKHTMLKAVVSPNLFLILLFFGNRTQRDSCLLDYRKGSEKIKELTRSTCSPNTAQLHLTIPPST